MRRLRGEAPKALHVCAGCGRGIVLGVDGPIVAATSLGQGFFHNSCAQAEWRRQRREAEAREAAAHARRVANGKRLAAERSGSG